MKFDFTTYMNSYINEEDYNNFLNKKEDIIEQLKKHEMIGWLDESISNQEVEEIKKVSNAIRENSSVFLVLGIGGSFLGAKAVIETFKNYFKKEDGVEVIFGGNNMSSEYMHQLLEYIEDKDVTVNVISKSGTTMEISIAFDLILKKLSEKYSEEELKDRIIVTTDKENGKLRKLVDLKGYTSFEIPRNIGGRFSVATPAGLLPIAVAGINIDTFLEGYQNSKLKYFDKAYEYACIRNSLYKKDYKIENFVVYEPSLAYFNEWLKQLFGESEGKDNKGLFPVSTIYTRDLHSLGQFIQSGSPIIFETVIRMEESKEVIYNNTDINKINFIISDSVAKAHYDGHTPSNIITLQKMDSQAMGELMYFFLLSAAFSGLLLEVNPFDQPGVEAYKSEVRKNLNQN